MLTDKQVKEMTTDELVMAWIRIGNALLDRMELPHRAAPGIVPPEPEPPAPGRRTVRG